MGIERERGKDPGWLMLQPPDTVALLLADYDERNPKKPTKKHRGGWAK